MKATINKASLGLVLEDRFKTRLENIKDTHGEVCVEVFSFEDMRTYEQIKGHKGLCRILFQARLFNYTMVDQYEDHFKIKCGLIKHYEWWFDGKLKMSEDRPLGVDNVRPITKSCANMTKKELKDLIDLVKQTVEQNFVNLGSLEEKARLIIDNMDAHSEFRGFK